MADTSYGGGMTGPGSRAEINLYRASLGLPALTPADYAEYVKGPAYATMDADAADWAADVLYPVRAMVRHAGALWLSLQPTSGTEPGSDAAVWLYQIGGLDPDVVQGVADDAAAAGAAASVAQAAAANAQASALTCATWAVLSGLTGATVGTGAEVLDTDAGTHTDPVAGGTVPNAGRYTWSASPAGWRRIGATAMSSKADVTALTAEAAARLAADQAAAIINLTTISGTGDAAVAAIPAALAGLSIGNDTLFAIRWPATNTATDPTLTVGGVTYTIKRRQGGQVAVGQLVADSPYLLRRHSGAVLKLADASDRRDVGLSEVDNTADLAKPVSVAQAEADREKSPTSGDVLLQTSVVYQMLAGAVEIVSGGRRIGMTIPAGQTGLGSYVAPRIALHPDDAARMAGRQVRIRTVMQASAGYLAAKGFGGNAVRVEMQDGSVLTNEGAVAWVSQDGTTITRDMVYTMVGTERLIAATMQIGSGATALGVEHYFQITSIALDVVASGSDAVSSGDAMLDTRLAQAVTPMALAYDLLIGLPQTFGGATKRYDARGREMGVTIPAGQSGQNTILQHALPVGAWERDALAGAAVRVTLGFDTSAGFARTVVPNMQAKALDGSYVALTASSVRNQQISSTRRLVEFVFTMPADMADLRPWLNFSDATVAVAEEYITLTDCAYAVDRQAGDLLRRGAETGAWGEALARRAAAAEAIGAAVGTGRGVAYVLQAADYATIQGALDAASGYGAAGQAASVRVAAGRWAERSLDGRVGADHVALVGAGRGRTVIDGTLPASTAIATIQATSTVDFDGQQDLRGLTVIAKNQRYAWHLDAVKTKPDTLIRAVGCEFIHLGNDEAEIYRGGATGETTTGRVTWASMHAVGCGLSSGQRVEMIDCIARGPRAGVQVHNQYAFDKPAEFVLDGCDLSAEWVAYWPLLIQSNGSGTPDRVVLRNSSLSGRIRMEASPWFPADLSYQPANHMEFALSGSGNSPCAVDVVDFGRALRITSATTGLASSVVLSGTAVPVLFGDVTTVAGDVGRSGAAYGYLDVQDAVGVGAASNVYITGLGKRLGNRVVLGAVALTMTVDGGAPVTVAFSGDYSASTNATILAMINAALGGVAVASEYNVGATYRPQFTDQERRQKNADTTTILQGMALARGASDRQVRVMTSADTPDLFAGIALEDIRPGAYGRVQHRGWIALGWVLRKPGEGSSVALGDRMGIDPANPGYITRIGAEGQILRCVTPSLGAGLVTLEIASMSARRIGTPATPEAYGARGGGADDTAAVRRCFAAGGDIVLDGTYLITDVVQLVSGSRISGRGKLICGAASGFVDTTSLDHRAAVLGNEVTDVEWLDVEIDTTAWTALPPGAATARALHFYKGSDIRVGGAGFSVASGSVSAHACTDVAVDRNRIRVVQMGALADVPADGQIDLWTGWDIDLKRITIRDNHIVGNNRARWGIMLTGDTYAGQVMTVEDVVISGNTVIGTVYDSIWAFGRDAELIGCAITGNVCRNGRKGISLSDARQFVVTGNVVSGMTGSGIHLWSEAAAGGTLGCVDGVVTGNSLTDVASAAGTPVALWIDGPSADVLIDGNKISGATHYYGISTGAATVGITVTPGNMIEPGRGADYLINGGLRGWANMGQSGAVLTGAAVWGGVPIQGQSAVIADDGVASFTPPGGRKAGIAIVQMALDVNGIDRMAMIAYRCQSTLEIEKIPGGAAFGAAVNVTTANLLGTTGTDARITVGVQNGLLKIENRIGFAATFYVHFL